MKNKTIIFRMTSACNLNCTYCYDRLNHDVRQLENEIFNSKISEIVSNISKIWENKNEKCEIIFHGGEPLIIDAVNYERLINNIKSTYSNVKFSIQTNGTLLNDEYLTIFKRYNVHIGISLDGYDEESNKYRIYKNGKNSFNDVIKKIELLNNEGINFGVIMTLNNSVVGNEEKLYNFIKKYKIKCNIRPVFQTTKSEIAYMKEEEYYLFFKNLFNIWINDKEAKVKFMQIKEIGDEFIKVLEPFYNTKSCSTSGNCFENFISLDVDGNLYSCNRTYRVKDFFYGNLRELTKEELENKIKEKINMRKQFIDNEKCNKCKLFSECRAGCPANAYALHGSIESADDNYCSAKLRIREYVNNYLEKNNIKKDYKKIKENG